MFYLLSLYVINKKSWHLTHIIYIFSLLSKPLTAVFLPMTLFFTYNSKIPSKRKVRILIPYTIILVSIVVASLAGVKTVQNFHPFDYGTFWIAFSWLASELRFDGFILVFLLPLTVGLYLKSRQGFTHADSILILIMGTILSHPLLVALTFHNILPYRYITFIVFFAVGVGILFSKKITQ